MQLLRIEGLGFRVLVCLCIGLLVVSSGVASEDRDFLWCKGVARLIMYLGHTLVLASSQAMLLTFEHLGAKEFGVFYLIFTQKSKPGLLKSRRQVI